MTYSKEQIYRWLRKPENMVRVFRPMFQVEPPSVVQGYKKSIAAGYDGDKELQRHIVTGDNDIALEALEIMLQADREYLEDLAACLTDFENKHKGVCYGLIDSEIQLSFANKN